jgi:uncharacterized protein YegL
MIKKLFKRIFPDKKITVYSVDERDKVIPVIKWRGVQYYRYKDNIDMRYGRYIYLATFIQAVEMRMGLDVLDAYLTKIEASLSGGKGHINIGDALITLKQIRTRTKIVFDEELAYNLSSCIFFTDSEPLDTYSMKHNKEKIEAWRASGALNFFMLEPVKSLLGLTNLSETDLIKYLNQTRPIVDQLRQAMQTASNNEPSTK